ncbi:MAG: hypothetical protein KKA16_08835 [Alphaproteobacteria bacterium]|nr:hypothetical protein [Alphaproteobacteria bacterium]MBU1539924.1 hypothetical protein [Alphaproteobacteria bacterium]MBU2380116.1 hypothetical protein [Alphaproteobacteria bacterium]
MIGLLAAGLLIQTVEPQLILTGVGRWAVFADAASITPDDGGVRMRALQVAEADFTVGGKAYWGGWSWWRFDCVARTADRLDFSAVAAGGAEGPATAETEPAFALSAGGDADELAAVACSGTARETGAESVSAAVALGRARLAD